MALAKERQLPARRRIVALRRSVPRSAESRHCTSTGATKARVTIDAVEAVQALSKMLQGLPERIRRESDEILKRAERSFERKDDAEGVRLVKEFIARLKDEGAENHATDQTNALIGVAQQIVDCRPAHRGEHEDEARRRD
jgi:hypothetical protein